MKHDQPIHNGHESLLQKDAKVAKTQMFAIADFAILVLEKCAQKTSRSKAQIISGGNRERSERLNRRIVRKYRHGMKIGLPPDGGTHHTGYEIIQLVGNKRLTFRVFGVFRGSSLLG